AQRRQKIYEQLDKDKYPTILIGMPKPIEKFRKRVEGDFEIKGNPMSQGVAEGRARVVPTFEEAHLIEKGDILITTATDTGWTPYFPLLGGVVTEIGGPTITWCCCRTRVRLTLRSRHRRRHHDAHVWGLCTA
ncbi:hypothetical protein MTO96_043419, partial [Rhipicephalus appendiculatus]